MVELSCEGDIRYAANFTKAYGGDTLNTAIAARRLGSEVGYLTRLGHDPFAVALKETFLSEGLDISGIRSASGQTGLYFVTVDSDGHREFLYYRKGSAASLLGQEDVTPALIRQAKIVYSSGITLAISPSARQAVLKAFRLARENDVMTAFDPNYRAGLWPNETAALDALKEILPLVDVMLPSAPEDTQSMIGFSRPEQVIEYFLCQGVKLVAAKAGPGGCYIGYKKQVEHLPVSPIRPVDTTGAGDAFNGGFLHGLATDHSLLDCARLGNTTAGLKILNRGTITAMPTRDAVYTRVFERSVQR